MNEQKLPPILIREDFDSDEEFDLYQSTEAGEWEPSRDLEVKRQAWKRSAEATINGKRSKISLAVPDRNLARIKALALRKGIPYQTLINQVIHKYVHKAGIDK